MTGASLLGLAEGVKLTTCMKELLVVTAAYVRPGGVAQYTPVGLLNDIYAFAQHFASCSARAKLARKQARHERAKAKLEKRRRRKAMKVLLHPAQPCQP